MTSSLDKERISLLEASYLGPQHVFKRGLAESHITLGLFMKKDEKQICHIISTLA